MNKSNYNGQKPVIGDNRYIRLLHKELLDPLRIIHYDYYGKDPSIQALNANDGYVTMFENGRFIPTAWYQVRGSITYNIQYSCNILENFTGSILISSSIQHPFNGNFSYLDYDYITQLNDYIKKYSNGETNFIVCDDMFNKLTFGHISLINHSNGEYVNFVDCAIEQLKPKAGSRDIIYISDDIKRMFLNEEVLKGNNMIEFAKQDVINLNHISACELEDFNQKAIQRILR